MARKILLFCGVLSSLLYVAMNALVPLRWPGYSLSSQVVSELSAVGAPTRALWVALAAIYDVLLIAFAIGVWWSAKGGRALRFAAVLLFVDGLLGFLWPPMHQREALAAGAGNLSDTLHIVFTVAWALLVVLTIAFAAAALGEGFRLYSATTVVILFAFGILTGTYGPRISANAPTPLVGIWERINIGAFVVWVIAFAAMLLRRRSTTA